MFGILTTREQNLRGLYNLDTQTKKSASIVKTAMLSQAEQLKRLTEFHDRSLA